MQKYQKISLNILYLFHSLPLYFSSMPAIITTPTSFPIRTIQKKNTQHKYFKK